MSKITYGLKSLYYSKITTGAGGEITYGTPVAIPGATEMSLSPSGDPVEVYADDTNYVNITVNQGYDGTVSVYGIPETFATDILGMTKDSKDVLFENTEDVQTKFALLGEFATETTNKKRWVLYECTAGRCDFAGKTKEKSFDPTVYAIPIVAAPSSVSGDVKATITGTTANATFAAWFTTVYEKTPIAG